MKWSKIFAGIMILGLLPISALAGAGVITKPCGWRTAGNVAYDMMWQGEHGRQASIESQAENDFITGHVLSGVNVPGCPDALWLNGFFDPGVDYRLFTYGNWAPGFDVVDPSNRNHYAAILGTDRPSSTYPPGKWVHRYNNDGYIAASVFEWNDSDSSAAKLTDLIIPDHLELAQNYPNPFNPTTTIEFGLPAPTHVKLDIFNVSGQRVVTLIDGARSAGWHTVVWNGTSSSGSRAASGVYFYRMTAGNETVAKKMLFLK